VESANLEPRGNVVSRDGDAVLATVALDDTSSGTYTSASLGPGVHSISAAYAGAASLGGGVSTLLAERIPPDESDFSVALSPSDSLVRAGGPVSSQVTVHSVNRFHQNVGLACSTGTAPPRMPGLTV